MKKILGILCVLALVATATMVNPIAQAPGQAVDENGAPMFRVDPFWPKPLKNRWSMQQVTGISVDSMDHIWFVNRDAAPKAMKSAAATTRPASTAASADPKSSSSIRQAR